MLERPPSLLVRGLSEGGELIARPRTTFSPPALYRVLPVLMQHWKFIAICTFVALAGVICALPLMETRYLVGAKVLVELGPEMGAPPTVTAKDNPQQVVITKRPEDIGSEIEIMTSPQLIEDVVNAFGVDFFLAEPPAVTLWQQAKRLARHTVRSAQETFREALILLGARRPMSQLERVTVALRSAFAVEEVRRSDVISVSFQTGSPEVGVLVLRKYLELFQEKHISTYRSPRVREFFSAGSRDVLQELQAAEKALATFKDEHKVWSIADQSTLLLKAQRDIADEHARTQSEMAEVGNSMAELQRQEALLPPDVALSSVVVHDPVDDEMRKQLAQSQAQLANGSVVFGERSPQMIQLQQQIATLKSGIAARQSTRGDQRTTGVNQHLLEVRHDISAFQARLTGLEARSAHEATQQANIDAGIQRLTATEATLQDMQRQVTRLDREYQLYTSGLDDSRISEAMDLAKISNVRVISPPTADPTPVWPPLLLVFAGAIIVGLGGSLAFVYLRDAIHPVVRARRDIEQLLGIPVLASVPEDRGLR